MDEEAEQEDNVGPHIGQVPGDLDYIKSGFRKVKFGRFKELMETGVLRRKKDLVNMWNARDPSRVVKIPGRGEVVQFLSVGKRSWGKMNIKNLGLNDVESIGEGDLQQSNNPKLQIEEVRVRVNLQAKNKMPANLSGADALHKKAAELMLSII